MRDERFELNIMISAQGADKITEHLVRVGATAGAARDKSTRQAAGRLRGTNGASSRKGSALLATAGMLSESVPNATRHETSHGITRFREVRLNGLLEQISEMGKNSSIYVFTFKCSEHF